MKKYAPKSEAELASIVGECAKSRKAISIKGGGTRPIGNPVAAQNEVSTKSLNGINLYEPGALTIIAQAGTPLEVIEKTLAKENQQLPFEPANYAGLFGEKGKSTIGGVVATGASGPRRIQAGGARDSLIGVRFVSGEGEIIKNGGRVMKNVTGYDLVKLLCGSYGTLGIITEVAFKVLPRPEMTGVVRIEGLDDRAARSAMAKALSSPYDVSGAAHMTRGINGESQTIIRVEGFTESIKYRTGRLHDLLTPMLSPTSEIAIELDQPEALAIWKSVRDLEPWHDTRGAIWRISSRATHGPQIAEKIREKLQLETLYDWGGGLTWLALPEGTKEAEPVIRSAVETFGGHATRFRKDESLNETVGAFHREATRVEEISRNLRHQFDPANILNPGRMRLQMGKVGEQV